MFFVNFKKLFNWKRQSHQKEKRNKRNKQKKARFA